MKHSLATSGNTSNSAAMSSIISTMLTKLFPPKEHRALMLGLDSTGRTTMLYWFKLGELVTTMPTIGFNVETIEHAGTKITIWDVGGCDKIRPLWRHYYSNTQVVMYFFDSNDSGRFEEAVEELSRLMCDDELRDCILLVWANKQDLPNARPAAEVKAAVAAALSLDRVTPRAWECFGCSVTGNHGMQEGLDWMVDALTARPPRQHRDPPPDGGGNGGGAASKGTELTDEERLEATLLEWLAKDDDEEDLFLQKFQDFTLESWDHYTHLRIAWLLLTRHGRREGMKLIFEGIENFIANSQRTQRSRGTTFHQTMTYFWVHMVDYARASTANPADDFKGFLLLNPQLCNGGMFLHYYSKKLMLLTSDARTQVLLPDVRPLPSLLSNVDAAASSGARAEDLVAPSTPLTDEEWLAKFEKRQLPSWGHEARLRLIWIRLRQQPRREALRLIFDDLKALEGAGHHVTMIYFWVSMVTLCAAKADEASSFGVFVQRPTSQCLRNPALIEKHYSRKLLDRPDAREAFLPPDIKKLPSVV